MAAIRYDRQQLPVGGVGNPYFFTRRRLHFLAVDVRVSGSSAGHARTPGHRRDTEANHPVTAPTRFPTLKTALDSPSKLP